MLLRAARRILLIALAAACVLAALGAIYQTVSEYRESKRFLPPGRLIPVDASTAKRRLHLVCIGEGEPTVIFEPAGFSNATSFGAAREELSRSTRVCSYDRMGTGW